MNLVDITKLLWITGIIIWTLPPIRQYKGWFFDFFLILAIIDPLSAAYGLMTKTNLPIWVFVLFAFLLIVSITSEEMLKKFKYLFIALPLVFILAIPYQTKSMFLIILSMEHVLLFLVFLNFLIVRSGNKKKMVLFYLMLVCYEIMTILKLFNLIIGFSESSAVWTVPRIYNDCDYVYL